MSEETTYTVYHKPCGTALSWPLSGGPIRLEFFINCLCTNCPNSIKSISELEVRASLNLKDTTKEEKFHKEACRRLVKSSDHSGREIWIETMYLTC